MTREEYAEALRSSLEQQGWGADAPCTETTVASARPPVVDHDTWHSALDDLRQREKDATRELDAIAAQRRRLPMVTVGAPSNSATPSP